MTPIETKNLEVATEAVQNDSVPNNPRRAFSKRAIAITAVLTACAALAIVTGLRSRLTAETRLRESAQASAIPYVDVVSPKASADADEIALPGSTSAFNDTPIYARTSGYLKSVSVDIGDRVKSGQVLFTLDRRPLEATMMQAQANLQRDIAQAANAKVVAQRYADLAKNGIATTEQLETSRMVHEGNLVRAADQAPLVVINQVAPIYVSFAIPESRLPDLKRFMGQGTLQVEAKPPNDERASSHGHITFIDNSVDQTTGTIRIKATFTNEDRRLWPGQFVNVIVALTKDPTAVVVPTSAVQVGQQGQYTYVVKADKSVEYRTVIVERTAGLETVIKSGLKPAETVVTDGYLRIVQGSRVSIKGEETQVTP